MLLKENVRKAQIAVAKVLQRLAIEIKEEVK
jgi:hypothetical protein